MSPTRRTLLLGMLLALTASSALAGGAINNNNYSSDYMRTLNRNAATDAADIVYYNPAGVTKLREGWTIKLDAQYITKDYSNTIAPLSALAPLGGGGELDQDEPSIVPGLFVNWRNEKWAAFFGFSNVAGGGKVDYDTGNWTSYRASIGAWGALGTAPPGGPGLAYNQITSHSLEAESTGLDYRIGGAYAFSDAWSIAAGIRYVDFTREADGVALLSQVGGATPPATVSIGFDEDATGVGGFLGLHIAPTEKLNIGIRYETEVGLELEQTVTASSIAVGPNVVPTLKPITDGILAANEVTDGGKLDENLPSLLGLGIGYAFTDKFRMEFDYMWYMDGSADLDRSRFQTGYDDSQEYGLTADWRFNDQWKISAGYLATRLDVRPQSMLPERPELDADSYAIGTLWSPNEMFDLSVGLTKNTYDDASYTDANPPAGTGATVTLHKGGYAYAAGLSFHF